MSKLIKQRLSVFIDSEVSRDLKSHVIAKHGKLKGFLALTVETAIKKYLERMKAE